MAGAASRGRWSTTGRVPAAPASPTSRPRWARAARRSAGSSRRSSLVSVVVPIAGAVIAFVSSPRLVPRLRRASGRPTTRRTSPDRRPARTASTCTRSTATTTLVDALRDETDETYAYTAVLYPRYAMLDVPTGTNDRYEDFYWNGEELSSRTSRAPSTPSRSTSAWSTPTRWSTCSTRCVTASTSRAAGTSSSATTSGTETQISAYASNEFSETSYLVKTLDGTLIYDSEAAPSRTPPSPYRRQTGYCLVHERSRPSDRGDGRLRLRQVDRRRRAGRAAAGAVRGRRRPAPAGQHRQDEPR